MTSQSKTGYDRVAKVFDYLRGGDMKRWATPQQSLFEHMSGKVLYVGTGTGQEIVNFPPGLNITAIDLSIKMLEKAKPRADAYDGKIRLKTMDTHQLAFADNSFDTVVAVCVFCTVTDPVQGLKEIKRVLKPNGKLIMFEHVMSRNPVYGLILRIMSIFTVAIEGTHLDRDTVDNIHKAGFTVEKEQNAYLDIVKALIAKP